MLLVLQTYTAFRIGSIDHRPDSLVLRVLLTEVGKSVLQGKKFKDRMAAHKVQIARTLIKMTELFL